MEPSDRAHFIDCLYEITRSGKDKVHITFITPLVLYATLIFFFFNFGNFFNRVLQIYSLCSHFDLPLFYFYFYFLELLISKSMVMNLKKRKKKFFVTSSEPANRKCRRPQKYNTLDQAWSPRRLP